MTKKLAQKMTVVRAIKELNVLTSLDPERAHADAEQIILDFIRDNGPRGSRAVANAFDAARKRVRFYYA